MTKDDMREDFESWFRKEFNEPHRSSSAPDCYNTVGTQIAWEAFQAGINTCLTTRNSLDGDGTCLNVRNITAPFDCPCGRNHKIIVKTECIHEAPRPTAPNELAELRGNVLGLKRVMPDRNDFGQDGWREWKHQTDEAEIHNDAIDLVLAEIDKMRGGA